MAKKNAQQPPDTGKLTNIHYGSAQDERTPELQQKAKKRK
ncbi:hypothetical protein J2S19_003014 [Metabacillus malikii]|uniref:YuzL family protein n=1 Tax=Metabacillus malikii TaxID=1504265 RepID=A0ABT9ZHG8_9BACI|nr:hypothetical protein [Metabacillus malikii]